MEKDIEILVNQYNELEDEIKIHLKSLESYGSQCKCGSLDQIELRGNESSCICIYCLECGGYITRNELF